MSYTPLLSTTTLGADLAQTATTVTVASSTGMVVTQGRTGTGTVLWIGNECLNVTSIPSSTVITVERGMAGTSAQLHSNGTTVTFGLPSQFGNLALLNAGIPEIVATATALPQYVVLPGMKRMDPNTGFVYTMVECPQAYTLGEFVSIDPNGVSGPITASAKGRIGIIQETIGTSGTLTWALTSGSTTSALLTSDVTTACILIASTSGIADILTSTGGNILWGVTCTSGPSSATDLGTVYINEGWLSGVIVSFSSVGT